MSPDPHDALAIGVITGSTRPGRHSLDVARWVLDTAGDRPGLDLRIVDLAEQGLPLLDEPLPAKAGRYEHDHTKAWAATIAPLDGFVFVTPEYNHSIPGALQNAIDFLGAEWEDKVAGVVRAQVALSLFDDFVDYEVVAPRPHHVENLGVVLDQVERWGRALRSTRVPADVVV